MSDRAQWDAGEAETRGVQFEGATELITLIEERTRRPRRWGRENLLPIIRLIRADASRPDPLTGLRQWLTDGKVIPHAQVSAKASHTTPASVEDLLDLAVTELAGDVVPGPRLRFPHYGLALWLVHLEPVDATPAEQVKRVLAARLQTHLRQRLGDTKFGADLAEAVGDFPWWVRLTARILPPVGLALMRSTWRPPRFFARAKLATRNSFYELARDFARPDYVAEHRDEVDELLVDAFLQDLRVAYRRGRPLGAGRRRTRYPVVLLSAEPGPGRRLLQLVDRHRTDAVQVRGERLPKLLHDPLLVVADAVAPVDPPPVHPVAPVAARVAYRRWRGALWKFDGEQSNYLDFTVPAQHGDARIWAELGQLRLPKRRRPWMTLVAPLLLLATLIAVPVYNHSRCEPLWWPGLRRALTREDLGPAATQCVGLAGDRFSVAGNLPFVKPETAAAFRDVEEDIAATNEQVRRNPAYVTVVFLSALTNTTVGGYDAALEELRGLALAQRDAVGDQVPIRLLLANAGDQVDHGRQAARLIARAKDRERIVAVTGLGVSRDGVREAILELAGAGIPTLGTLLTADSLTTTSFYYHQIGPANLREAVVGAYYAKAELNASEVSIYYAGDPADLYSGNLAEDARAQFTARGIRVREVTAYRTRPGTPGGDVTTLGRRACAVGRAGLVFFSGRPDEFARFLQGMAITCPAAYPRILAGDAITESVLSGQLAQFPGLPLDYLTPASSLAWGPDCRAVRDRVHFFDAYEREYGGVCGQDQSRAMFGYDAFTTLRQAVIRVHGLHPDTPVRPDAVLQGIGLLAGGDAVAGVTGTIDFSSGADPQLPRDKAMLVIGLTPAGTTELRLLCGTIQTAPAGDPKCPQDG
ncbi:hypothetical protein [Actinoplanes sp. NPDC049265]|uniref:hypothetical protein n=1 Tax=Actinoplanes sp. NPDC049265 TaxID=3363902 RepID=UPI0037118216